MRAFSPETRKLVAAAAAGPLAIIPALVLLAVVMALFQTPDVGLGLGIFIVVGLVVAYPAVLLVGIPSAIVLQRLNKLSLGSLITVALLAVLLLSLFLPDSTGLILLYCYCAVAVAAGCWWAYKNA